MEIKPKIDPKYPPDIYGYKRATNWAWVMVTLGAILLAGALVLVRNANGNNTGDPLVVDNVVQTIELVPDIRVVTATVYAYTSRVEETDSDPFTTASGEKVREGIVANNCLEFGTKVDIEGEIYEVKDRMNRRYSCENFDIWHSDLQEARQWGKRTLEVIIYQ